MSKLVTSKLQNICMKGKGMIISGPFGSNISSKYFVDLGVPVIRGNNLNIGLQNFNDEGFVFVTEEKADKLKCDAIRNDLIFTAAGTIGQVGYIPSNSKYERYVISNKQIRARLDLSIIDLKYAFYWFSSPWIFKILNSNNKGSTVPLLTLSEVKDLSITYPKNIEDQKKISNVLEKITSKINNNIRMNSELESMAKTIYDYWFLQFEFPNKEGKPYKSSGGKMVWNKELKREIPEGWEAKNVSDLSSITWGQCPDGKNILPLNTEEESIDYCSGAGDMHGGFIVDCQAKTNDSRRSAKNNDILVSVAGAIGNICVVDHDISLGRAAMAYTSNKDTYLMFLYQSLKALNKKITSVSSGSIQKVVNSNNVKDFNIPFNEEIVDKYSKVANPIFAKMKSLSKENRELASLRDWLLPMLMNGQITFK